jgi:arabinogalactan endo-1,4-beta-galactosidase
VQVGNETNDGLLWNTGKVSTGNFVNYAKFINSGINAVKNYNTNIKTMLHIAEGNNNGLFRWNVDGLINSGLDISKLDIIGMSLYPESTNWKTMVDNTYANMLDIKTRYNKEVMMAEIGFSDSRPDIAHQFLIYMIEKTRQAAGLGVFYWEPIVHKNWKAYSKGAWDADGSPSVAMDAFIDTSTLDIEDFEPENNQLFKMYPNPSTNVITIIALKKSLISVKIFDILGKEIKSINAEGIFKSIDVSNFKIGIYTLKINNLESIKFLNN